MRARLGRGGRALTTLGPASAWGTTVYAGDAVHPETHRRVHLLGFQTRITNDSPRANAVVLPVPSAAPLDAGNLIEVPCTALDDLAATLRQMDSQRGFERPDPRTPPRGAFHVAFAHPDAVVPAISPLPTDVQPPVDRRLFKRLGRQYPGAQLALCCWTGAMHSAPVLLWYEPLDPQTFFLSVPVDGDHVLVIGSSVRPFGIPTASASATDYLPSAVWGRVAKKPALAGDYDVLVAPLQQLVNVAGKHDLHPRLDPKLWSIPFVPRVAR